MSAPSIKRRSVLRAAIFGLSLSAIVMATAGIWAGVAWEVPGPPPHALLNVEREQPWILYKPAEQVSAEEFANFLHDQLALLKSRLVLNSALRDPKVANLPSVKEQIDPLAWLEARLRVNVQGRGILRVAVTGGSSKEQALLVNAVASAYLEEVVQKEVIRQRKRLEKLRELSMEYDTVLQGKRDRLKALLLDAGGIAHAQHQQQQRFAEKQVEAIEKDLLEVQAQIRKAKIEIALSKAAAQPKPHGEPANIDQLRKAEEILNEERKNACKAIKSFTRDAINLDWLRDEIREVDDVQHEVRRQLQVLNIEIQAPPRVNLLEEAVAK
jgi:hypothetical protein